MHPIHLLTKRNDFPGKRENERKKKTSEAGNRKRMTTTVRDLIERVSTGSNNYPSHSRSLIPDGAQPAIHLNLGCPPTSVGWIPIRVCPLVNPTHIAVFLFVVRKASLWAVDPGVCSCPPAASACRWRAAPAWPRPKLNSRL